MTGPPPVLRNRIILLGAVLSSPARRAVWDVPCGRVAGAGCGVAMGVASGSAMAHGFCTYQYCIAESMYKGRSRRVVECTDTHSN